MMGTTWQRTAGTLFASLVLIQGPAAARSVALHGAIRLPSETVTLRRSELPGFAIATQKCAICHSADYIAYQPPGLNQSQWTSEVAKMHGTYGAPIDDAEIKLVGAYLAVTYGDAKTVSAADRAPGGGDARAVGTSPAGSGAVDVQGLLTRNACLGCHATNRKIVGPAYHDVATRYQGDPQAVNKLQLRIRQGGSGLWGTTAMPAFAGLSDAESKALAEFVMKQ